MRYVSLFSGIEAASCAWEPLGWEAVAFSEIDPFCNAVLATRFPSVPNLGDISKVEWKEMRGEIDVVIGGSPCQSFSVAGRERGSKASQASCSNLFELYVRSCRDALSGRTSRERSRARTGGFPMPAPGDG
ncbi:MAG: DNA cytosine methyltransferase [Eggerthella lenta]